MDMMMRRLTNYEDFILDVIRFCLLVLRCCLDVTRVCSKFEQIIRLCSNALRWFWMFFDVARIPGKTTQVYLAKPPMQNLEVTGQNPSTKLK